MRVSKYSAYFDKDSNNLYTCKILNCNHGRNGAVYTYQSKSNGGTTSLLAHLKKHDIEYSKFLEDEKQRFELKPERKLKRKLEDGLEIEVDFDENDVESGIFYLV
jgi:L-rhamnose mutarotase